MLTNGCGFKVIDQAELSNFYIENIDVSGDRKVNFIIKNKIKIKANDINKEKISLNVKTEKRKTVKEKNSKNEITKYLIQINTIISVINDKGAIKQLNLGEQGDYNVATQYSQTINNENQAIKTLTNKLADKIIKEISKINFNDL